MASTTSPRVARPSVPSRRGQPAWELARLFPDQGEWSEEAYLALNAKCLVELSGGCLEFLEMPTRFHQLIVLFLYKLLDGFVAGQRSGEVHVAPLPVRLSPGKYREPDVVFLRSERLGDHPAYPEGADLVMEVVSQSPEDRRRDLEIKRMEYAAASIPEYWIVDPEEERITVLTLDGRTYREHGVFGIGEQACSLLLPGFCVDVSAALAAGRDKP